jgi:hypothetical protein
MFDDSIIFADAEMLRFTHQLSIPPESRHERDGKFSLVSIDAEAETLVFRPVWFKFMGITRWVPSVVRGAPSRIFSIPCNRRPVRSSAAAGDALYPSPLC